MIKIYGLTNMFASDGYKWDFKFELIRRIKDDYGSGEFGASRDDGKRTHNGIDFGVPVNKSILSPINGKISKFGYPYYDNLRYKYVQITDNKGLMHRIFYCDPNIPKAFKSASLVIGSEVIKNETVIGVSQNIVGRYSRAGMINHIHYEIKTPEGEYLDPDHINHDEIF